MGRLGEGDRGTCCGQAPGGEKATKRHGRNSAQLQLWVQMHWHGGQGPGGCTAHPRGPRSPCPQGDGTGIPGLKYSQAERGPVPHGPGTLSAAAGLGGAGVGRLMHLRGSGLLQTRVCGLREKELCLLRLRGPSSSGTVLFPVKYTGRPR